MTISLIFMTISQAQAASLMGWLTMVITSASVNARARPDSRPLGQAERLAATLYYSEGVAGAGAQRSAIVSFASDIPEKRLGIAFRAPGRGGQDRLGQRPGFRAHQLPRPVRDPVLQ